MNIGEILKNFFIILMAVIAIWGAIDAQKTARKMKAFYLKRRKEYIQTFTLVNGRPPTKEELIQVERRKF